MANMKLKDIPMKTPTNVPLRLVSVEERESRNGDAFCNLEVSDGDTTVVAKMWKTKKQQVESMIDHVILSRVTAEDYRGERSYKVDRCIVADEDYDISEFVKTTPEKPEEYKDTIISICREATGEDSPLYKIVDALYLKYSKELLKSSAAKGMHHNLRGGLMQHTATMVKEAKAIAENYPFVDAALLVCATALHDIGKIKELNTTVFGDSSYSFEGNMFGHAYIGMNMVDEGANMVGVDPSSEKVMLLKHCIASHHGKLEWGAITTPMIPEAFILHSIDMIDSRMYQYDEAANELEPGTFSERKNMMLETIVYRKEN